MAGIPVDPVTNGAVVDENCQTKTPGIFACGNVLQVHDLVDYVSEEAERAGIGAAMLVAGHNGTDTAHTTKPGEGVRYVLPQIIRRTDREVSLFFRVTRPFGKVKIVVTDGETVLAEAGRPKAAPGEMEKITLKAEALQKAAGELTVKVVAS